MRSFVFALGSVLALSAAAQQKPGLTAEQVLEKSIEASGGRAAMEKLTSMHATAMMEASATEMHAKVEVFSKAPNKQLVIVNLESMGEIKQGVDGDSVWSYNPMAGGLQEVTGAAADDMKRAAVFNAPLKWRTLYSKVELVGQESIGDRKAYVIRLIPLTGSPDTHFFDADTFLMIRQAGKRATPQGEMELTVDLSDYHDVNGIKVPFHIKQKIGGMGEMSLTMSEVKYNVPIEDSVFAKPAK